MGRYPTLLIVDTARNGLSAITRLLLLMLVTPDMCEELFTGAVPAESQDAHREFCLTVENEGTPAFLERGSGIMH